MNRSIADYLFATVVVFLLVLGDALFAKENTAVAEIPGPGLKRGTLVICGGGDVPQEVMDRFVELAGGEEARIVVIPTASDKVDVKVLPKELRSYRFASLSTLHTTDRAEADNGKFVESLNQATGVWFVGGQQYRIASAYLGTAVEREVYEVLKRGGVVAGTSAGAAIQSRVMIAGGNPLPEMAIGFDLLPGAIIDQHFTERDRQPRLKAALKQHPELLGVGIDEDTAIVVTGQVAEVMGRNGVHIYDGNQKPKTLLAGMRFDLKKRAVVEAKVD